MVLEKNRNCILSGAFSVSANKQVKFSKGNLQYKASTKIWRFAENQYDMIGEENLRISETNIYWMDLFCWGTSGYNSKYPYMTSTLVPDYYADNISNTDYDWGVYNAISNGGNEKGLWRTLTSEEWQYLFINRKNAPKKYAPGTVNNVHGLIILPDRWRKPRGLFITHMAKDWTTNNYSTTDWIKMEVAGAVFLPAAGWRLGSNSMHINDVGSLGIYCSSSYYFCNYRLGIFLSEKSIQADFQTDCRCGYSVRLVQDL